MPSDKSLSHRVALFSALAEGSSRVYGLLNSLDVRSTLDAIEALGARLSLREGAEGLSGEIVGWGAQGPRPTKDLRALSCGNSGTTARLLLGILSRFDLTIRLEGDRSLCARPMSRVTLPLAQMGAHFDGDRLPLSVRGTSSLRALDYLSPLASAQVKSAVLLAGLGAQGLTRFTEPQQSRNHTERLLPAYGARLRTDGLTTSVEGGQQLHAYDCALPGDPSSAAFLLVAAALIPHSKLTLRGLLLNPTRLGFLEVMRRMGADISVSTDQESSLGLEQRGDVSLCYREGLVATTVEPHELPSLIDEVPILALLATAAEGTTVFQQVGELRVKESDRLASIVDGLVALGCDAWISEDDLHVSFGRGPLRERSLPTHGDHRLAMTYAIAERAFGLNLSLADAACVKVSYPRFFEDLERLSY
jgi:3-phosphoshikimate 1-carboxyvinyltransferase